MGLEEDERDSSDEVVNWSRGTIIENSQTPAAKSYEIQLVGLYLRFYAC